MTNKSEHSSKLDEKLQTLPEEITPNRDLWQGIELAITSETTAAKGRHKYLAIAASVLVPAGLIGMLLMGGLAPDEHSDTKPGIAAQLSSEYERQKAALLVTYSDQEAVTDNWQSQLNELETAADAIKAALENDPNNRTLLRMLQSVYQQQIDLIERVHAPKWQQI
ncbi:hypothetical protein [Alteromonas gilva]|uniref:Uncharacterized protein n=1 Tax=Alteromonas gilva TaxID=2987522 RepID=A0ABT5L009_9ALTE|nr:hypothetical protein [Alteromonas gilva]MDC8829841.1 hypothetical protein [Alteromonas gilva]